MRIAKTKALNWLNARVDWLYEADLKRSAIVFAPHQDDETLGCGGTIIRKIALGANVKIVFMTDGSRSHPELMGREQLQVIRMEEAKLAAKRLGIAEKDVLFLNFEDGKLAQEKAKAIACVADILGREKPEAVFIPYYKEAPSDHRVTNEIVLESLGGRIATTDVFEYPIWFWKHWPWVRFSLKTPLETARQFKHLMLGLFHIRKDLQCAVRIEDVVHLKGKALRSYKSQLEKHNNDETWTTLKESGGEDWLEHFSLKSEYFYRH